MFTKLRAFASAFVCALILTLLGLRKTEHQAIEDVVYGDRIESTVSDTSISITAMNEDFLMDMGIQGPNEMVNYIPATT